MKKYIAIQMEDYDFELLTDDDGITSAGGLNCEVFGVTYDWYRINCFLNKSEYEDICKVMDYVVDAFNDLTYMKDNGFSKSEIIENSYYHSYKAIIEDYLCDERFRKYSSKMVKELKAFAEKYGDDTLEDITDFLTITTGMEWVCKRYDGYSQGDVCYLVYCTEKHTKDYMDLIGNAAVGRAVEFGISENLVEVEDRDINDIISDAQEDCCYGYYLTDNDVWNEDIMKSKLAEYVGCKADEIEVLVIENTYIVRHNKYKVA